MRQGVKEEAVSSFVRARSTHRRGVSAGRASHVLHQCIWTAFTRGGNSWTRPERFPDFFLIGAPRCGTTSLSRYLADNPQVCFSRPKEPHYFSLLAPHASLDDLENRLPVALLFSLSRRS